MLPCFPLPQSLQWKPQQHGGERRGGVEGRHVVIEEAWIREASGGKEGELRKSWAVSWRMENILLPRVRGAGVLAKEKHRGRQTWRKWGHRNWAGGFSVSVTQQFLNTHHYDVSMSVYWVGCTEVGAQGSWDSDWSRGRWVWKTTVDASLERLQSDSSSLFLLLRNFQVARDSFRDGQQGAVKH